SAWSHRLASRTSTLERSAGGPRPTPDYNTGIGFWLPRDRDRRAARPDDELGREDDLAWLVLGRLRPAPAAVGGLEPCEEELGGGVPDRRDVATHDGDLRLVDLGDRDVVAADEGDVAADLDAGFAKRQQRALH